MRVDCEGAGHAAPEPPIWPELRADLPVFAGLPPPRHVHLIWSLTLGGAERIVADLGTRLGEEGAEVDVILLRDAVAEHRLVAHGVLVHRLGKLPRAERIAYAAGVIRASRLPAYCHLLSEPDLRALWALGCETVPVFHNAPPAWKPDPAKLPAAHVPFVVACGEAVADALGKAGLCQPIRVLRHIVEPPPPMDAARRLQLRAALGAAPHELLIGMVGRFSRQKDYPKAVRILAELRRRGPVRLAIIGPAADAEGQAVRHAVDAEARRLGVRDWMVMPGPVIEPVRLMGAFDVFLNTSAFEGVSIATMEAVASGVAVVSADVGGQREAVAASDRLVAADAPVGSWADAIMAASLGDAATEDEPRPVWRLLAAAARMWPWLLVHGPGADAGRQRIGALFVTGNLDVGGAQRSLCNLAEGLAARGLKVAVAVAGPIGVPGFMAAARRAGAEFLDISDRAGGLHGRAGRVLALSRALSPESLVFWNLDAATKLLVVKAMQGGPVRLVDVSPGPMLYRELDKAAAFVSGLGFSVDQYLRALDLFVAKYAGGAPPAGCGQPKAVAIIPNGVPPASGALAPGEGPAPPPGADPALAVVTVGRLAPAKRPDLLPLVARALHRLLPGATLTVVGAIHAGADDAAWHDLVAEAGGSLPANLFFAGPDHRTTAFLGRFACFYMVSSGQGCPNASLEAMAAGLPVVANPDGGTVEQVVAGVTGWLVPDDDDRLRHAAALACALADILRDPVRARAMGEAGRKRALQRFSIDAMVDAYAGALMQRAKEKQCSA